jgi:hypothetical protein
LREYGTDGGDEGEVVATESECIALISGRAVTSEV